MLEFNYIGSPILYDVNFSRISSHIVQVLGELPFEDKGFTVSRKGKKDEWNYAEYTTLYRKIEGGIQFSNDGTVYKPQEVEQHIPTLEETKAAKKQEIYVFYNADVAAGISVELSTGMQHFPLSSEDREFLMGKQLELVGSNAEIVSYQDSDNHCMLISRSDMQKIITEALAYVNVKTTYRNNLCEWVDQCETKEAVENIIYGASIPEEYQNEVFKMYLAQQGV